MSKTEDSPEEYTEESTELVPVPEIEIDYDNLKYFCAALLPYGRAMEKEGDTEELECSVQEIDTFVFGPESDETLSTQVYILEGSNGLEQVPHSETEYFKNERYRLNDDGLENLAKASWNVLNNEYGGSTERFLREVEDNDELGELLEENL